MDRIGIRTAVLAGFALALTAGVWAQSTTPAAGNPQNSPAATSTPATAQAPATAPAETSPAAGSTTSTTVQPAPGATPAGGDAPAPAASTTSTGSASADNSAQLPPCETKKSDDKKDKKKDKDDKVDDPEPGTTPVGSDCAGPVDVNKVIEPGSQMIPIKAGSIEDRSEERRVGKEC